MSVVIAQGPGISGEFAKVLADRIHAERRMPLAATAWCLEGGNLDDEARAWCAGNQVDVAQLVTRRPLSGYRVLAMDMDSTLIAIECIDELAALAGVGPKVAAITAAAMQGGLDFPSALKARVALLAGLDAGALARVYSERLELSQGAQALLDAVRAAGLKTLLVSGGFTYFTGRLSSDLSLDHALANELEIVGGRLTGRVHGPIVDADAKAERLAVVCRDLGCTTRDAIVIGDGANDLKMMALAGLSVAFRAKPLVQRQADAALNFSGLDGVLHLVGAAPLRPENVRLPLPRDHSVPGLP
ncbi:MAG: phosphoserine phosphatase SerB [Verrucomicrobiae bacterium]|nr:phosphoserine phosphatase SerB [Verrucomicrobiae bacterium]